MIAPPRRTLQVRSAGAFQETGKTLPGAKDALLDRGIEPDLPELQAAILGDKTVDEALQAASDAVDGLMRENGVY